MMQGNPFNDPGATATDAVDGNLNDNITNDAATMLDVNTVGTYTVTYSVSDAAGNTATATRSVVVNSSSGGGGGGGGGIP